MRQLSMQEVNRPLEPAAEGSARLRALLEELGVKFEEDDDPYLPSPSQTAAIELNDGSQFAFEHFYTYGDRRITIRAQPGLQTPRDRIGELQTALGFDDEDILAVHDQW